MQTAPFTEQFSISIAGRESQCYAYRMRGFLSALLIVLLTCVHGPLSAAMPHDFAESHHHDSHHSPDHQDEHAPRVAQDVEAADTFSNNAPAFAGHHQHLVADAVSNESFDRALVMLGTANRRPADDSFLVQDHLASLLEPPIA